MDKNFEKTGITEFFKKEFKNIPDKKVTKKKIYSDEFKTAVIQEYLNGVSRKDILSKYDISSSALYKWISSIKPSACEEESEEDTMQKLLRENEMLKKVILMLLDSKKGGLLWIKD